MFNATTEVVTAVTAGAVIAAVATRPPQDPGRTLLRDPRGAGPVMATAALVFALQMVNFPVAPGTSGHLLGGALATALVGPRRALLAVSSVVVAQALFFADGGVAAVGLNLWLIAILPVAVAAAIRAGRSLAAAGVAAVVAPPLAALAFVGLHVVGGATEVPAGELLVSMVGVHLLVGFGEAALTLVVLGAVRAIGTREDRTTTCSTTTRSTATRAVWGAALVSAAGLSALAASTPDGLERVADDLGFAVAGPGSVLERSPLADYAVAGSEAVWSIAAAGLIGVVLTCAVAAAMFTLAGRVTAARGANVVG